MRAALPLPPDLTWILCGSAAWQYTTLRNHTLVTAGQLHPDFRPPRPFSKQVATSRCPFAYVAAAAQAQDLKCENLLAPTHPRLRDSSARIGQSPASHFFLVGKSTYSSRSTPTLHSYGRWRWHLGLGCFCCMACTDLEILRYGFSMRRILPTLCMRIGLHVFYTVCLLIPRKTKSIVTFSPPLWHGDGVLLELAMDNYSFVALGIPHD